MILECFFLFEDVVIENPFIVIVLHYRRIYL